MSKAERCPECGAEDVTRSAGPLPICTSCEWTGWDEMPVTPDMTLRTDRMSALLAEIGDNLAECFTDDPARYVLAECSIYDRTIWLTTHDSPRDAARYHDTQEYPQDWPISFLVDLDTGMRFSGETETTFSTGFTLQS